MGVDFDALLFYGMPIDGELGWELIDTVNEADSHLEVMNLSPMTDANYILFVRESYHAGDRHSDEVFIKFSDLTGKEVEWRQLIRDACDRLHLEYVEPDWYFATTFS